VVFEGSEIVTGQGAPFKVFTPYKRAWLAHLTSAGRAIPPLAEHIPDLSRLTPAERLAEHTRPWSLEEIGFRPAQLDVETGERGAATRLADFLERIDRYRALRDHPSAHATSGLSVHLRFGTIAIRALFRQALARTGEGAESWVSELIWREFFQMILDRFPHVVTGAFRREYDGIVWPGSDEHFEAWCRGRTGYPIVDAAMRHFNRTGWMHNRLRMVTASFLVKDLLIDWRRGEAFFARGLLDFDLAANNGGWQWCASTGCDAQPWFRIFNPVSQSRKFDPDGSFLRSALPELRGFSDRDIHWPVDVSPLEQHAAGCVIGTDYPAPIVNHAAARTEALKLFKFIPRDGE
jgi:deoxyribodipyrimidine photo-lyase